MIYKRILQMKFCEHFFVKYNIGPAAAELSHSTKTKFCSVCENSLILTTGPGLRNSAICGVM